VTAYKANPNFEQEKRDAVDMLVRAVTAADQLSTVLQFVAFQTGAKGNHPLPYTKAKLTLNRCTAFFCRKIITTQCLLRSRYPG
jgi:hypothetical protein